MKKLVCLISVIIMLTSCGRFGNKETTVHTSKERIISASKQYTELMYALGLDSTLVAVDLSSTYPPQVKNIQTIGYHMKLSFEGMMSLNPTQILHHGGKYSIGPEHVVKQLNELNVPLKTFNTKAKDIESTKALMREMGSYFNKEKRAEELCQKLDVDMKEALQKVQESDTVKVVVIHYGRATNMYLVMGANSTAGQMLNWAGGKIPIKKRGMEKMTSPEIVAQANPDVILLTDYGFDRLGSFDKVLQLPGVALTNAAKNGKIYRVNGHDLIYYGPRTGENILKLQKLIHQ